MKIIGALLIGIGTILVLIALMMNTGVPTGAGAYGSYLGSIPAQVANLDLMQKQLIVLQIGLALFVSGSVLFGAGHVSEALASPQDRSGAAPPRVVLDAPAAQPVAADGGSEAREPIPAPPHKVEESEWEKTAFKLGFGAIVVVAAILLAITLLSPGSSSLTPSQNTNYTDEQLMNRDVSNLAAEAENASEEADRALANLGRAGR